MKYKYILKFQYNGKDFNGYGTQPHKNTIQDKIEEALTKMNSNTFVKTFSTSRTDAKVHAYEQYIQFYFIDKFEVILIKSKLNKMLPNTIRILDVYEDFEDKINVKDVISKTYKYVIMKQRSPFELEYASYISLDLEIELMQWGANHLVGTHDFTSFCNTNTDVENKVRTINFLKITSYLKNDIEFIEVCINADGFLYNMVRLIVGALIMVGNKKIEPDYIKEILETQKKTGDTFIAPPEGLYLKHIYF